MANISLIISPLAVGQRTIAITLQSAVRRAPSAIRRVQRELKNRLMNFSKILTGTTYRPYL